MKHYIFISIIAIITLSCKAQNIVPYDSGQSIYIPNSGDYYKDTNNFFNTFEGEWEWEDIANNSSFTLMLQKETNLYDNDYGYSYDLLVGEYEYVQNGIILANTLADINNPNIISEYHNISGIQILTKYNGPQCLVCSENEKRMEVIIEHDNYEGVTGTLIMRHIIQNGVEKLNIIVTGGGWLADDQNAPNNIDVPFGEYLLVKQ